MDKKKVAIVVGGGPAPGINGVIAAVTIEAINQGYQVLGVKHGFEDLIRGDDSNIMPLRIEDVSTISSAGGSILSTSRANPTKSEKDLLSVVQVLKSKDVGYLVTIGGDDTANTARALSKATSGSIKVGHVPKTIDNDLPLPGREVTFGFHTACEAGTNVVQTLQTDARTTRRWYFVIAMGRKAGHLALGIGISSGATLTIVPEDFQGRQIHMSHLVDIIVGSMIKRRALKRNFGVVVLAEGIADCIDPRSLPGYDEIERDPHGNVRFSEIDIGLIIKTAVKTRLRDLGISDTTVVDKNVGYELRCSSPVAFDRIYTQQLGCGVIGALLSGCNGILITRQSDELVPVPLDDFLDPTTGKTKIRMLDTDYITYKVARKYMIKITKSDLEDDDLVDKMLAQTNLTREKFLKSMSYIADDYSGYDLDGE